MTSSTTLSTPVIAGIVIVIVIAVLALIFVAALFCFPRRSKGPLAPTPAEEEKGLTTDSVSEGSSDSEGDSDSGDGKATRKYMGMKGITKATTVQRDERGLRERGGGGK
jgi:hypothetical protein